MPRYFVFSLEHPFRQADGFFVREDGEVCFWPSSRTGYVIPEDHAKAIIRVYFRFRMILLIALGVFLIGWPIARFVSDIPAVSKGVIFLPFVASGVLSIVAIWQRRRLGPLLKECPKIRERRPPAIDRRHHIKSMKKATVVAFFTFALLFSLGSFWIALSPSKPWLSRGGALLAAGFLFWAMTNIWKMRRESFAIEDHIPPGGEWTDRRGKVRRSRNPKTDST